MTRTPNLLGAVLCCALLLPAFAAGQTATDPARGPLTVAT